MSWGLQLVMTTLHRRPLVGQDEIADPVVGTSFTRKSSLLAVKLSVS
jgi:hypothetical protein